MTNKSKLSLLVLDEYAKTLTAKQVKKLYESKTNKKYNKALFEKITENELKPFQYWLSEYTMAEYGLPGIDDMTIIIQEFMNDSIYKDEYQLDYINDSICFYTKNIDAYEYFLDTFVELYEDILPNEIINQNIDRRYLKEAQ